MSFLPSSPALRRLTIGLFLAGGATIAFAVGLAAAAVAARFGAVAMVALPLAVAVGFASLRRPWIPTMLLILALPLGWVVLPGGLELIRLAGIAAFATTFVVQLVRRRPPLAWTNQFWLLVVLVGLYVVSMSRAIDPGRAQLELIVFVSGVLVSLTAVTASETERDMRTLVYGFCAVGAGICLQATLSADELKAAVGGDVVENRAAGIFAHPNELGCFAMLVLLCSLGALFGTGSRRGRLLAGAACVAAGVPLVISLSRGAWIGTAFGLVAFLVLVPRARRPLLAVTVVGSIAAVVALIVAPEGTQVQVVKERVETFADPLDNPYDDRPSIYAEALHQIGENPLLGVGPGNFLVASARTTSKARTVEPLHAHNAVLTVAAEAGLVAAVVLVVFTLSVGLLVYRASRHLASDRTRPVVAGLGAALLGVAGQGLMDFPLRNPVLFTSIFLLLGLALAAGPLLAAARRGPVAEQEQSIVPT